MIRIYKKGCTCEPGNCSHRFALLKKFAHFSSPVLDISFKLPLFMIEPVIFIRPTLTYFLGTIRNTTVTTIFLGLLLSCGTAYLIYLSLARNSCGLESILTFTLEVYYKFIVCHDLSFILHNFFNLLCSLINSIVLVEFYYFSFFF